MREKMLKASNKVLLIQIIISGIIFAVAGGFFAAPMIMGMRKAVEIDSLRDGVPYDEYLDIDEYDVLEGQYVTLDVQYILDTYYKKSGSSSSAVTHYGYLIYDEESGYMMGIYVNAKDSRQIWSTLASSTRKYLEGRTDKKPTKTTIKGTFRKMTGSELSGFKGVADLWGDEFFEFDYKDYTLMYTIDSTGGVFGDSDGRTISAVFAALAGVWCLICLVLYFTKASIKNITKYINNNGLNETEVEADYNAAKVFKDVVYVGRRYTFFRSSSNWQMMKNDDLVWAYYYRRTGRYSISRINAYHYNKDITYINVTKAVANEVLNYYAQILPQIIVGYSTEWENEYTKNYNVFLSHRYTGAKQTGAVQINLYADSQPSVADNADTSYGETASSGSGYGESASSGTGYGESGGYALRFAKPVLDNSLMAVKIVREVTGLELDRARTIVDNGGIILNDVSYEAAKDAAVKFEKNNIQVSIVTMAEL